MLATDKWRVKKGEGKDPFEALDRKLPAIGAKGRKVDGASGLPNGKGMEGKAKAILKGEEAGGLDW